MAPRREARGAIPMLLHAQLVGLRGRHDLALLTVFGDEAGDEAAVSALRSSGVDVHAVDTRVDDSFVRWRRRWRLAATWARGSYPWRTVWFADPRVQQAVDQLAETRKFDVVAVEDNAMGVFHLPPDIPSVLTEHEVRRPRPVDWRCGPPAGWPSWAFQEADWRRWPKYERSVWRRFDRLQVFTQEDADAVSEIAPDLAGRVTVNPFGIELPPRADPRREEPDTLLFSGNFTHPPNVDAAAFLVLEVMPRLQRELHGGGRLLLVGSRADEHVGRLGGGNVSVIDGPESMGPYLDVASVVIAPLRTGGGMRVKVLQALGAGKPVVTTSRGARGLVHADGELPLVVAEGADGLAAASARLLRDESRRRSLGERARRFVIAHHSAAAYARRLERVYEETVTMAEARR
ncbi:MAG: glycosyltransferase family 4 protein, partial [Gaiellaceae bacterium]